MKKCNKCLQDLPIESFHRMKHLKSGHNPRCKSCVNARNKDRWIRNKARYSARYAEWRNANRQKLAEKSKRERTLMKEKVYSFYGNACACCGETNPFFLALDHINNDGNKHRREHGSGFSLYRWILKSNFPNTLQILCHNCNVGKHLNGGVCPHKTATTAVA